MEQRRVGRSGLVVSRLGLGTMTWGRDTDEHESADQLRAFLDAGGTLLDTAVDYAGGAAEQVIGGLLRGAVSRADLVLATKAGVRSSGSGRADTSRGGLLASLDLSLRRLGVDAVDLWQVATWSDAAPLEETLAALDDAVRSGRTRYVGVCNYSGWQTARAATCRSPRPFGRRWCRPRWSTRCWRARSRPRCCRPRRPWVSVSSRGRRWAAAC